MKLTTSNFDRVSEMNVAFGNPKGDPDVFDLGRIFNQCLSIPDETGELFTALGCDEVMIKTAVRNFKLAIGAALSQGGTVNMKGLRDALCDVHVFAYGAHHMLGIDADADMNAVVDGVMTRFIKDENDKKKTIALHAANGVTDVYFEGKFPTMVMKSGSDQPDAPKGKFLKSASYRDTVFPKV